MLPAHREPTQKRKQEFYSNTGLLRKKLQIAQINLPSFMTVELFATFKTRMFN